MALTYEEKCAINRKNSSRSTGPKTREGKEKARQNAMTHGLRAETLALPNQDAAVLKELHDEWLEYYRPASPAMRAMLDHTVFSHVQFTRCHQFHAAAVADQARKAVFAFDQAQDDEVERFKKLLKTEPYEAVRGLNSSAAGCRWMMEQWSSLRNAFVEEGSWVTSERHQVVRLLGERPEPEHMKEDALSFEVCYYNTYARGNPPQAAVDWIMDKKRVPDWLGRIIDGSWEPDVEMSRRTLLELIDPVIAEITAREEKLRTELEEPSRAGAADRALLLDGPEGAKYLRYAQMHHLAFHRSFKGFLTGEPGDQRAEEDDTAPIVPVAQPTPVSQPAPFADDRGVSVLDITAARPAPNEANAIPSIGASEGVLAPLDPAYAELERAILGALTGKEGVTALTFDFRGSETPPARGV